MQSDGKEDHKGFSKFERLKNWSGSGLRALTQEWMLRDYEDTLRRLMKGDFADLSPAERRARVEQIINLSAMAAMAMASAPIPFLEIPVQMAMVRVIAKINGVEKPGKKALMQMVATLGGGLFFRQLLRFVPIVGPIPLLSRIYGATWALGHVSNLYFSTGEKTDKGALRQIFEATMEAQVRDLDARLRKGDFEEKLKYLDGLLERDVITGEEYGRKRRDLLEGL